jgi:hypothetical protein
LYLQHCPGHQGLGKSDPLRHPCSRSSWGGVTEMAFLP